MSFPKYPEYKECRAEGLGQVPVDWDVSRLGYESWVRARLGWKGLKAEEYVDEGFAFLSTPNIKERDIDFENVNYINQVRYDESPEIKLQVGDVLLAKDGSTLGTVNVVRTLPRPSTVNSSIAVITPRESLHSVYLYYLFRSSYMEQTIQEIKGGMGVPHLFQADLVKFYIPVPSGTEQRAIAAFLDRETGTIDGLVVEQRRLIELLKEKRHAVISHAVTKGLNPHAKLKPSGIDWLGDVPEHWEIQLISRFIAKITNGYVGPTRDILVEDGLPYIQATHIKNGRVNFDGNYFVTPEWSSNHAKSILEKGDVLIVQTGAGTGDVGLVSESEVGFNCHSLIIVQCNQDVVLGEFLAATLQASYGNQTLESIRTGGMHPHLNCGNVKYVNIPVPPLEEQASIVVTIEKRMKLYDGLIAEAERAIELLQERRTALISAAVTGQIDVREFAPQGAA